MVWANRSIDSLEVLLDRFVVDENKLGIMIGQRELGKLYRENNRFDNAIEASLNGLKAARELEDTLETTPGQIFAGLVHSMKPPLTLPLRSVGILRNLQ